MADVVGNFAAGYGIGLTGVQAGTVIFEETASDYYLKTKKNHVIEGIANAAGGVVFTQKLARRLAPDGNAATKDRFAFGGYQGFVIGNLRGLFSQWF